VNFGSHAGRVILLVVALVNDLTPGFARGRRMPVLTADVRRARAAAVVNRPLRDQEANGLTRLAERLRPVFAAAERRDATDAGRLVNAMLGSYRPRPGLVMDGDGTWHLHFHSAVDDPEAGWGAGCATALAGVLSSEAWHRLGVCSASACDRVFVDLSRNGSRRFCSPACQNRTKAAALRARRRDAASGAR
jgi:predicted RNA-binding Zn ribbon-like protein